MKYPKLIEFGNNLRVERVRRGYSLEKFGQICNLNPTHIGKIERAEMNPTLLTILSLLEALDLKFEQLVQYNKHE
ncbi:helix-turn-helix transcriptional regulator [Spirochaetes bacterium]|uniref:Helix-turn-helix transcriptional regulator n=1 Tax=Candidatus Scatousia excrementipullorum TaxID=2840936 RepID=A0A9D9DPG4_9BACT|nr:helix-turn-helix transcriptional regulator [Candidatus Scatousia excrementipullorum]